MITVDVEWEGAQHPHQTVAWARALCPPDHRLVAVEARVGRSGVTVPLYVAGDSARSPDRYAGPIAWGSVVEVAAGLVQVRRWMRKEGIVAAFLRACPTQLAPPFHRMGNEVEGRPTVMVAPRTMPVRRDVRRAAARAAERYSVTADRLRPMVWEQAVTIAAEAGLIDTVEPYAPLLNAPEFDVEVWTAYEDRRPVAFTLTTRHAGVVEVECGAVLPEHRTADSPLKLIDVKVLERSYEHGDVWVNFGPGVSGEPDDGVLAYKLRLGGVQRADMSCRVVPDVGKFEARCREAGIEPRANGWFPPWPPA